MRLRPSVKVTDDTTHSHLVSILIASCDHNLIMAFLKIAFKDKFWYDDVIDRASLSTSLSGLFDLIESRALGSRAKSLKSRQIHFRCCKN